MCSVWYKLDVEYHLHELRSRVSNFTTRRVVRQENMFMRPAEPRTKNDSTGEAHQQLTETETRYQDLRTQL